MFCSACNKFPLIILKSHNKFIPIRILIILYRNNSPLIQIRILKCRLIIQLRSLTNHQHSSIILLRKYITFTNPLTPPYNHTPKHNHNLISNLYNTRRRCKYKSIIRLYTIPYIIIYTVYIYFVYKCSVLGYAT